MPHPSRAEPEGAERRPRWLDGATSAMLEGDGARPGPGARRTRRDWAVDVLMFLVAAGVGALALLSPAAGGPMQGATGTAVNVGLGCASVLSVWLRRRWPVHLAVVLGLVSAVSSFSGGAAAVALFTVVVHRSSRTAAAIVALNVVMGAVYTVLYPDPELPWWATNSIGLAFIALITAWALAVRSRRDLVRSLWERADRAEAEQQVRVDRARGQERERIAREMHDVLAHRISLLSLHAGALEFRADASAEEVQRAAGVIRASAHQALEDLREVIGVLRDAEAPDGGGERPQPGVSDLPGLVDEGRAAGMRVRTDWDLDALRDLPASTARSAYRIVQEALTNARKHAPGAVVEVRVAGAAGEGLEIAVVNPLPVGGPAPVPRRPSDRTGAVPERAAVALAAPGEIPGAGTGLVGLAERATLSGGELEHGVSDGRFHLRARLAWPA